MKILLAEDDLHKSEQIRKLTIAILPTAELFEARSFRSSVRSLRSRAFDLVLLDMSMPAFDITDDEDGGRHDPYAGREVLSEMERFRIFVPVIVITQFDRFGSGERATTLEDLDSMLRSKFPRNYSGYVFFDAMTETWRDALRVQILSVGPIGAPSP